MPKIYDKNDLFWTSRGDYMIGDGDLADTYNDPLRSFIQEVKTRSESDQGDWKNFEHLGATIKDFIGEPNTVLTADQIKTRLITALAQDGFVNTRDVKIRYIPIARDKLMFRMSFNVAPTARNGGSTTIVHSLLYSFSDNNIYTINGR